MPKAFIRHPPCGVTHCQDGAHNAARADGWEAAGYKLASAGRLQRMEARLQCNHHPRKLVVVAAEHFASSLVTP